MSERTASQARDEDFVYNYLEVGTHLAGRYIDSENIF